MRPRLSSHTCAVLQALFVTFLWSTSWVLIKIGLEEIPALTFAGLRYLLAFLVLLPFALGPRQRETLRRLPARRWLQLLLLGVLLYAVTQGAQFLSLLYLPATMTSLLLSFTAVIVAFLGIFLLQERPALHQWAGAALYLVGVLLYFIPVALPAGQMLGFVVALVGVLANALSAILGRALNSSADLRPSTVTVVSMGSGALLLFGMGTALQGLPRLSWSAWAIILWLAVVNSAFAFTLWNRTLQELSALESSIINNTMLLQIALLAWLFLGEAPSTRQLLGLLLAAAGTFVVQVRSRRTQGP